MGGTALFRAMSKGGNPSQDKPGSAPIIEDSTAGGGLAPRPGPALQPDPALQPGPAQFAHAHRGNRRGARPHRACRHGRDGPLPSHVQRRQSLAGQARQRAHHRRQHGWRRRRRDRHRPQRIQRHLCAQGRGIPRGGCPCRRARRRPKTPMCSRERNTSRRVPMPPSPPTARSTPRLKPRARSTPPNPARTK